MKKREKQPNPIINLFKLTWEYSEGKKHIVILIIFLFFIANTISLATPYVIGKIFNLIQTSQGSPTLLKDILVLLSLLLILTISFWLFHGPTRILERRNGFFVKLNYKIKAFNKILELQPSWHRDNHSGDTIDKINEDQQHWEGFQVKCLHI